MTSQIKSEQKGDDANFTFTNQNSSMDWMSLCSRLCPNDCMSMIYLVLTITTEKVLLENWSVEVLSPSLFRLQLLGCRAGIWVRGISPQTRHLHHPFTLAWPPGDSASQDWHTLQVMSHTSWFFLSLPFPHFPSFTSLSPSLLQPLFLIWIHSFAYFVPLFGSDQLGQNMNHYK